LSKVELFQDFFNRKVHKGIAKGTEISSRLYDLCDLYFYFFATFAVNGFNFSDNLKFVIIFLLLTLYF